MRHHDYKRYPGEVKFAFTGMAFCQCR